MINLHAVKINVDFDNFNIESYKNVKIREDGLIEIHDRTSKTIIIKEDHFFVEMHFYPLEKEIIEIPWETVIIFHKYFTKVKKEFMARFTEGTKRLCFEFDFYYDPSNGYEPEETFIDKYIGWPYFQFEFKLSQIFSIKKFYDLLNNKYDIYQVFDRGWDETKMFFKDFTVESISRTFNILHELIKRNNYISDEIDRTKNILFEINERSWFNNLENIQCTK